jgi:hypothetical protein
MMPDKSIEDALAEFRSANRAYATQQAVAEELEFRRPVIKEDAIRFLIQATPIIEGGKPLAYTAAERQVESVPAYSSHCAALRDAREATQRRWGEMKAAQLYATAIANNQENAV